MVVPTVLAPIVAGVSTACSSSAACAACRPDAQRATPSGEDRLTGIVLSFFIEFGPAQRLVRDLSELSAGRLSAGGVA